MLNLPVNALEDYLRGKGLESYVVFGEDVVARSIVESAEKSVINTLTRYHKEHPAELGLKESSFLAKVIEGDLLKGAVRAHLPMLFRNGLLDTLVDRKAGGEALKCSGAIYSLLGHTPASEGPDKLIEDGIMGFFGEGCLALKVDDIIKGSSAGAGEVKRVLRNMVERGDLVRLKEGLYMSAPSVSAAQEKLVAYFKDNATIKAADFRDLLGCGRKLAIEILEYFDGARVTLRNGDLRTLR
jgi:selenocysteine-specific elongation factor